MKPIEVFQKLIDRFLLSDQARRWKDRGPGKVVEAMSEEDRATLSQLKSEDIGPDQRVEEYWMAGKPYERKLQVLQIEKEAGVEPPPRKKYDDFK